MNHGKADIAKRFIAALIDSIIAGVIAVILSVILGTIPVLSAIPYLVAAAYLAVKDALPVPELNGMSLGKKLFNMKAVTLSGGNLDYQASIKRNAPLWGPYALSAVLGIIPFLGALVSLFVITPIAIILICVEIFKVVTDERGIRLGDTFAGTVVAETSAGLTSNSSQAAPPPPPSQAAPSAPPPPPPAQASAPPPPSDDEGSAPPPPPPSA